MHFIKAEWKRILYDNMCLSKKIKFKKLYMEIQKHQQEKLNK